VDFAKFGVTSVVIDCVGHCYDHAYCNAAKSKSADSRGPSSTLLIYYWEGGEHHVESAVDYSHVDRKEKHNGFHEEEDPGTG